MQTPRVSHISREYSLLGPTQPTSDSIQIAVGPGPTQPTSPQPSTKHTVSDQVEVGDAQECGNGIANFQDAFLQKKIQDAWKRGLRSVRIISATLPSYPSTIYDHIFTLVFFVLLLHLCYLSSNIGRSRWSGIPWCWSSQWCIQLNKTKKSFSCDRLDALKMWSLFSIISFQVSCWNFLYMYPFIW